ncbi:hypothetical protein F511_19897 [Dorcoceras hygrometricum]|uniref:Acyl-CoA dehydrogenase-related protein n=1 Tax=Dorcoceras hygrometricum TaxID=472368 RepID=A0A2Z7APJ2_9LAMI|nr:hypothetical protein F511_19897 [Dorcoceras hygrometricum]
MSLFDLQDVCIAIGSIATPDLPMVVDLIGIYGLKGPYCTLTTTNWFLQALSVIPRGSWGDVARRFTMIRWAMTSGRRPSPQASPPPPLSAAAAAALFAKNSFRPIRRGESVRVDLVTPSSICLLEEQLTDRQSRVVRAVGRKLEGEQRACCFSRELELKFCVTICRLSLRAENPMLSLSRDSQMSRCDLDSMIYCDFIAQPSRCALLTDYSCLLKKKKKIQVISTADESVSSRKVISTVDESINSRYPRSKKKKISWSAQRIEEGAKRSSRCVKSTAKQLTNYQSWMSTAELISNGESDNLSAKEKDASTVLVSDQQSYAVQIHVECHERHQGSRVNSTAGSATYTNPNQQLEEQSSQNNSTTGDTRLTETAHGWLPEQKGSPIV